MTPQTGKQHSDDLSRHAEKDTQREAQINNILLQIGYEFLQSPTLVTNQLFCLAQLTCEETIDSNRLAKKTIITDGTLDNPITVIELMRAVDPAITEESLYSRMSLLWKSISKNLGRAEERLQKESSILIQQYGISYDELARQFLIAMFEPCENEDMLIAAEAGEGFELWHAFLMRTITVMGINLALNTTNKDDKTGVEEPSSN